MLWAARVTLHDFVQLMLQVKHLVTQRITHFGPKNCPNCNKSPNLVTLDMSTLSLKQGANLFVIRGAETPDGRRTQAPAFNGAAGVR